METSNVAKLIRLAKRGNREATGQICEYYSDQVVSLGKSYLRQGANRGSDEYDAASSVFRTFIRRMQLGEFSALSDQDGLWRLLATITVRKSLKQARKEARRNPVARSEFILGSTSAPQRPIELILILEDILHRISSARNRSVYRDILVYKVHGYTHGEIANEIGLSLPTVERKLRIIRQAIAEAFLD